MVTSWKVACHRTMVVLSDEIPIKQMEICMQANKLQDQKYLRYQALEMYGKDWDDLTPSQKNELRFYLTQMIINNY